MRNPDVDDNSFSMNTNHLILSCHCIAKRARYGCDYHPNEFKPPNNLCFCAFHLSIFY